MMITIQYIVWFNRSRMSHYIFLRIYTELSHVFKVKIKIFYFFKIHITKNIYFILLRLECIIVLLKEFNF